MIKGVSMIDTLRDFVQKMEFLGIEYMVTGSYAMAAYGEIRMTRDIDVVVDIHPEDAARFARLFETEYYVSENSIRRALADRRMFNIVSNLHGGAIDCIIQKETDFARASFSRRYRETVSDIEFWATTPEDLMVAKLEWARETRSEMQIRDIANLSRKTYDADYVDQWVRRLDLGHIWAEVEKWKTEHKPLAN